MRRIRQRDRAGHGVDRSRSGEVAPRGSHCALEHAGLRARTERTARLGPRLRHSDRCALPPAFRAAGGAYRARRAGAQVWRAGRLLRLARTAEVQDAHPRVFEPLAEFSRLPFLRRHAAAARGPGRADRRSEHRRNRRDESPRRRRVLPPASTARLRAAGRPDDARTGASPARVSRGCRAWLPHSRPHAANAKRRRGPPRRAYRRARVQPGGNALRARRAVDRAASPRHQPTPRRDPKTPRTRQHRGRGRA